MVAHCLATLRPKRVCLIRPLPSCSLPSCPAGLLRAASCQPETATGSSSKGPIRLGLFLHERKVIKCWRKWRFSQFAAVVALRVTTSSKKNNSPKWQRNHTAPSEGRPKDGQKVHSAHLLAPKVAKSQYPAGLSFWAQLSFWAPLWSPSSESDRNLNS